jgi:hypothetical protein
MKSGLRMGPARCAGLLVACALTIVVTKSDAGGVTYTYDNAGRLRWAVYGDKSSTQYTLDAAGNRITVATRGADVSAPNPPTGFTATPTSYNSMNVTWTPATDNAGGTGISGYYLSRWTPASNATHTQIAQLGATATSFPDTNLAGSTQYTYGIVSFDLAGNQSPLVTTAGTTQAAPPPTVPTTVKALAWTTTQVTVTWTGSTDSWGPGVGGYNIYRGGTKIGSVSASTNTYLDSTVTVNGTWLYTVSAYDTLGIESGQSTPAAQASTAAYVTNTGTMKPGVVADTDSGFEWIGFTPEVSIGSFTPATLTGGQTVSALFDEYPGVPPTFGCLNIAGFSNDPGPAWLSMVTVANINVTRTAINANYQYGLYGPGIGSWCWNLFNLSGSATTSVSIVHR